MKKTFTLSVFTIIAAIFLQSCLKDSNYGINEAYWLSKERGVVAYSDSYCNYYVVETNNGYNIIRSNGIYKPSETSIVYGDFSYRGTREFYNRSSGLIFTGTLTDYWLTYTEAQHALDYYCPVGKGQTRVFVKTK
jgi:hypothetical protein